MIRILKASAGSGKTFNLAKTYIRLLLENEDPFAYRHILAVTFTNKATDEMKSRILKELHTLSVHPSRSPYYKDFVPSLFASEPELKRRSENALFNILHDYGAFAVSTIDRFFQQTLKAFSREIGQFATYQVELDKDSLVKESVDRILDSLTEEDKRLLGWLSDSMMDQLEQGRRANLDESLTNMAKRLKSDEHRSVVEEYGIDDETAYSRENLARMKTLFRKVTASFLAELKAAAEDVATAFAQAGVPVTGTSGNFLGKVMDKFAALDRWSDVPKLTEAFRSKADDFGAWFRKADQPRYAGLEDALHPPVLRFVAIYDKGLKAYNTSRTLLAQVNDLGIASDLSSEFKNLLKEKNVLSLDDSNVILKNIIDGSDAPFVYEKLGVRFEHFLLDEFQDTSRVQWENFKPLIANSDASGAENLLVGDVKQSIYRWRGSDWKLMAREVKQDFPNAEESSLGGNWRSLENIVKFNNGFFSYASGMLDRLYGDAPEIPVSEIYDARSDGQEAMSKSSFKGSVEAIFCPADQEDGYIISTIGKVMEAGARPGDITILVRNNQEGSRVAALLMTHGIDVVSDDSLRLKSSLMVRKTVSLLSYVRNPEDEIGSYLAGQAGLDPGDAACHSLLDLCEGMLRRLRKNDAAVFDEETQYIQSFMDYVQDHVAVNGNSLEAFLKAWEDADPKVSSPADVTAVRVMTIHKAKGLEFAYVILPYAETVGLFRSGNAWIVPDVDGTPLEGMGKAAFDVLLSGSSTDTLFEKDYRREKHLQFIDNINTFYVALTRASKGMTVISASGCSPESCMSGILYQYLSGDPDPGFSYEKLADEEVGGFVIEGAEIFSRGGPFDFSTLDRKGEEMARIELGYPSFPLNPENLDAEADVRERGRLKFKADSVDFFLSEDRARARSNGIVMHAILSEVRVPADLEKAVRHALDAGDIDEGQATACMDILSKRIAAHPEWFPESGAGIFNETSLIDIDGREWRPDRVVEKDGRILVIDYKFGEKKPSYRLQVSRYAEIYRRMHREVDSAVIWYVLDDEAEVVDNI